MALSRSLLGSGSSGEGGLMSAVDLRVVPCLMDSSRSVGPPPGAGGVGPLAMGGGGGGGGGPLMRPGGGGGGGGMSVALPGVPVDNGGEGGGGGRGSLRWLLGVLSRE